jgi:hypothetical protein
MKKAIIYSKNCWFISSSVSFEAMPFIQIWLFTATMCIIFHFVPWQVSLEAFQFSPTSHRPAVPHSHILLPLACSLAFLSWRFSSDTIYEFLATAPYTTHGTEQKYSSLM